MKRSQPIVYETLLKFRYPNARYRSLASVPVRSSSGHLLGVLVGTSDCPNRFYIRDPRDVRALDPVEPLRNLAAYLAMLIDVTYIRNQPTEDKQ